MPYEREIAVNLPDSQAANDSLASLWARTRIDELSSDKLRPADPAKASDYEKEITSLGLNYRLMTSFTSFVAVEDRVVNQNGKPVTVQVPVELPDGMNRQTTLGDVTIADAASLPVNGRRTKNYALLAGMTASGGGGGGGSVASTVTLGKSKPKRMSSNRSGRSGSGNGVGYGSGSGNGNGSGYGNGSSVVALANAPASTQGDLKLEKQQPPPPKSPTEIRDEQLKAKLHVWLYMLINRNAASAPSGNESKFVRDGKAEIRIELTSDNSSVIEKLKSAGFEITSQKGGKLIGRISIEKLAALADIVEVKYILPVIE
jgi:hypothetical protein